MLTAKRLEYLTDLLPENVSWGDPLNAVMLDQILAAHSAGVMTTTAAKPDYLGGCMGPTDDGLGGCMG